MDKITGGEEKLNHGVYQDAFFCSFPKACDLVFSYGGVPVQITSAKRKPIVCEQTYAFGGRIDFKEWKDYIIRSRKLYVEKADLLITPSRESVDCFTKIFPQYIDKIRYIPYFLPYLKAIEEGALTKKFSSLDKINVLFVGKEAKRKGLDTFIEAYIRLPEKLKERFEVTVISKFMDGPQILPAEFIHKTFVEDITSEFNKAHLLVFLTKREAYGLVLVEAMASGCNILTTDHPIQKSIMNETGAWFVNPLDTHAIQEALVEIAGTPWNIFYNNGLANVNNFKGDKSPVKVSKMYFDTFSSLV